MKPETAALLCTPGTHQALELVHEAGAQGPIEALVNPITGARYAIHAGIPQFVDLSLLTGLNLEYLGFYNRYAGVYDAALKVLAVLSGGSEAGFRKAYLQELEIPPGGRFLEVSIGTGANLRLLPPQIDAYGVDLSPGMLARCRRSLTRWGRTAELFLANAEELPFWDATFDAVLHVGGINAFNDRAASLREMLRVAKRGAKIVVVDETDRPMQRMAWIPSVHRMITEWGDRFSAPVGLVPESAVAVSARPIVRGFFYCLTFRKAVGG